MGNDITTMKSEKFGKVRLIFEGDKTLYCAADVTNALGYSNGKDAIKRHCRWVVKRDLPHPQSPNKRLEASFLPEADVYRLICHSKLPAALEFEKWVFEDVVPKAVDDRLNTEPEQLTLETSEYHYFHKTFKGEPVITVADFVHFTEISANSVYKALPKNCIIGTDYERLEYRELAKFKAENHIPLKRMGNTLIVLRKSGIDKLMKFYNLNVWIPMAIRASQPPVVKPMTADEILNARKITRDDCIIALDVLRRIESNCENNVKMAAREGRSTQFYGQELSEVKNVIKGVGMLLVMGY